MSLFKFRVALEQDDTIYRDIEIKPTHTFAEFHQAILKSFGFDSKHEASFYKSNDNWSQGEEISLNKKGTTKQMDKIALASFIDDPHEKFIYVYDYEMEWTFLAELMGLVEVNKKSTYPRVAKTEGIAPKQYGNHPIVGKDVESFEAVEIYDETEAENMGEEGDEDKLAGDDGVEEETESEFGEEEFGTEKDDF